NTLRLAIPLGLPVGCDLRLNGDARVVNAFDLAVLPVEDRLDVLHLSSLPGAFDRDAVLIELPDLGAELVDQGARPLLGGCPQRLIRLCVFQPLVAETAFGHALQVFGETRVPVVGNRLTDCGTNLRVLPNFLRHVKLAMTNLPENLV